MSYRKISFLVLLMLAVALTNGCAVKRQMKMTYHSVPEGATLLSEDNKNYGRMPVTLTYNVTEEESNGEHKSQGMSAYWPNGTKKKVGYITNDLKNAEIDCPGWGVCTYYRQFTFVAPDNYNSSNNSNNNNYNNNQKTYNSNRDCGAAQREYDAALRNYNIALEQLDSAKNMSGLANLGNSGGGLFGGLSGMSKKMKVAGLLSRVTSHGEVQEAERNLSNATERLNQARYKVRMCD